MNSINLVGRLTKDPKILERTERTLCEMRLAVDNPGHKATFITVVAFDDHAYACGEYLSKGHRVAVNGKLTYDYWRSTEGEFCERYTVIGKVDFLDSTDAERRRQLEVEPPYTPEQSAEELLAV